MTYGPLLQVAVEAARRAGDLLRVDLLRRDGPDCQDWHHAAADEHAEDLIRRSLLAATPTWGYLGEEMGAIPPGSGQVHRWIVDPNDGTFYFCQGARGSAVSIAAVREDVPVLAVVYAFAAPDNEGDLFAWAEGTGPLRRNGIPQPPRAWASSLGADSIIIVSRDADRAPAENLRLVAPGRYRTEPSIAYRLALVAAGEGEVAVSLGGCRSWDYAAGHGLIRGQGGEVVDERGDPVRYDGEGEGYARFCFGGAPTVVRQIASRPWQDALDAGAAFAPQELDLVSPARGTALADNGLLRRAQGCWLGQLAGDALGSMVDLKSGAQAEHLYTGGSTIAGRGPALDTQAGQPSVGSEMALVLARTLLRDGVYNDGSALAEYAHLIQSRPSDCGDPAGQTIGATDLAVRGAANTDDEPSVALMRQSPLAIWGSAVPAEELDRIVRADTALTHPSRVCQDASAVFVVVLAATIREGLDARAAHGVAVEWDRQHGTSPSVTAALVSARQGSPSYERDADCVIVALQDAFFQALHARSFEEGVVRSAMAGSDANFNAAVAGALLGAVHGARQIPNRWARMVLSCRPQQGAERVQRPRPRAFWPVDALTLTERLLVVGRRQASPADSGPG